MVLVLPYGTTVMLDGGWVIPAHSIHVRDDNGYVQINDNGIDISSDLTTGNIILIQYDYAMTLTGTLTGMLIDFKTNITQAGTGLIGIEVQSQLDPFTGFKVKKTSSSDTWTDGLWAGLYVLGSSTESTASGVKGAVIDLLTMVTAGAPDTVGLFVKLPTSYTNLANTSMAGYFVGDGRTVNICDDNYAINVVAGASYFAGDVTINGDLQVNAGGALTYDAIIVGDLAVDGGIFDIDPDITIGNIINVAYDAAKTLTGALVGINLDLAGNVTPGANAITGLAMLIDNSSSASSRGVDIDYRATAGNMIEGTVGAATTLTAQIIGLNLDLITNVTVNGNIEVGAYIKVIGDDSTYGIRMDYRGTGGAIILGEFGAATTFGADVLGIDLNLVSNVTAGANVVIGARLAIPSSSSTSTRAIDLDYRATAGRLVEGTFGGATILSAAITALEFDLGTNVTTGGAGTGNIIGLHLDLGPITFNAAYNGTVYGLFLECDPALTDENIEGIRLIMPAAYGSGTERGIYVSGDSRVIDIATDSEYFNLSYGTNAGVDILIKESTPIIDIGADVLEGGIFVDVGYDTAETLTSALTVWRFTNAAALTTGALTLTGMLVDFQTNVTASTGIVIGTDIRIPASSSASTRAIDIDYRGTAGILIEATFGAATVPTTAITGINLDMSSLTPTDFSQTGFAINTHGAVTNITVGTTYTIQNTITGSAIVSSPSAAGTVTTNWNGLVITNPNATSTAVAGETAINNIFGVKIITGTVTLSAGGGTETINQRAIEIDNRANRGTIFNMAVGAATTLGADITGLNLDLNTNVTGATDNDVIGYRILMPVLTQSAANTTNYYGFRLSTAGALVQDTLVGTINWYGSNIQLPVITQTTGTIEVRGHTVTGATVNTGGTVVGYYANLSQPTVGTVKGVEMYIKGDGTNSRGIDINWRAVGGIPYRLAFDSATTLTSTLQGIVFDLKTNVTVSNQIIEGFNIALPAAGTAYLAGGLFTSPDNSGEWLGLMVNDSDTATYRGALVLADNENELTGNVLFALTHTGLLDMNPRGTGTQNVIDITPAVALAAGSTWRGILLIGNTLDPAAGVASTIIGYQVDFESLVGQANSIITGIRVGVPDSPIGTWNVIDLYNASGQLLFAISGSGLLDMNPRGTGTQNVIDITPAVALAAGSSWTGLSITGTSLNPLTGVSTNIYGISMDFTGVASADGNDANIYGIQIRLPTADTAGSTAFVYYSDELTVNGTRTGFQFNGTTVALSATATYRGFWFDGDGITRDANAPILEGIRIDWIGNYTGFGTSYAMIIADSAWTQTTADTPTKIISILNGGALTQNTLAGTMQWIGQQYALPAATQTTGLIHVRGIDFTVGAWSIADASTTGATYRVINMDTPALTLNTPTGANTVDFTGIFVGEAPGDLVTSHANSSIYWRGTDIRNPQVTQTAGICYAYGLNIIGGQIVTAGRQYGIYVDMDAQTNDVGINYGLYILSAGITVAYGILLNRVVAFTGVAASTTFDLRIDPNFTLTEPAGGTYTYYGASIELDGIAVTAGVGTTFLSCLNLIRNTDADVGASYHIYAAQDFYMANSGGNWYFKDSDDTDDTNTLIIDTTDALGGAGTEYISFYVGAKVAGQEVIRLFKSGKMGVNVRDGGADPATAELTLFDDYDDLALLESWRNDKFDQLPLKLTNGGSFFDQTNVNNLLRDTIVQQAKRIDYLEAELAELKKRLVY